MRQRGVIGVAQVAAEPDEDGVHERIVGGQKKKKAAGLRRRLKSLEKCLVMFYR
jgi:hypothetical protein